MFLNTITPLIHFLNFYFILFSKCNSIIMRLIRLKLTSNLIKTHVWLWSMKHFSGCVLCIEGEIIDLLCLMRWNYEIISWHILAKFTFKFLCCWFILGLEVHCKIRVVMARWRSCEFIYSLSVLEYLLWTLLFELWYCRWALLIILCFNYCSLIGVVRIRSFISL